MESPLNRKDYRRGEHLSNDELESNTDILGTEDNPDLYESDIKGIETNSSDVVFCMLNIFLR